MYIRLKDGSLFAFAGLYTPGKDGTPPSCAIVTTTPNELLAPIHARMPALPPSPSGRGEPGDVARGALSVRVGRPAFLS